MVRSIYTLASRLDPKSHARCANQRKQCGKARVPISAQRAIKGLARQAGCHRNIGNPPVGIRDRPERVHNVTLIATCERLIQQRRDVCVIGQVLAQEVGVCPTACRFCASSPPSTASLF